MKYAEHKVEKRRKDLFPADLNQEEFAKRCGISFRAYKKYLKDNGQTSSADTLTKMADVLDVSVDWLLDRTKYLHDEDPQISKVTGLSEKSIETLRALNRMATEYPDHVDRVYMPGFVVYPNGSTEKVSDAELVEISTRYCDDPCAAPSAIIEALNDLLETTQIDQSDYAVDSALLMIAEYMRADKAVVDELPQMQKEGKPIQLITFRDGLLDKSMDVKELYRERKQKHVIAALDEVISMKEEGAEDGKH